MNIPRLIKPPTKSFLLLGPRGTGKSTWLRQVLPDALWIDLLESHRFLALQQDPGQLAQWTSGLQRGDWVVIDEVQRVPSVLQEVHRLYESKGLHFALSGSSARKLRREGANLLAGRALQTFMFPFVHGEYRHHWSLEDAIAWGTLPLVVAEPQHRSQTLAAYVETYLKEEITAEALVRQLDPFVRALAAAGLYNGQILNIENLSRESAVKRSTIERYFQILEDTLIAVRIPALSLGIRTKETTHPKFFLFDSGIARAAAGLLHETLDSVWKGFAFESMILHELRAYNERTHHRWPIFHYAVSGGFDVDFLVQTSPKTLNSPPQYLAIEVKLGKKYQSSWIRGLRTLRTECPKSVTRTMVVYQGSETMKIDDVEIIPAETFLNQLSGSGL